MVCSSPCVAFLKKMFASLLHGVLSVFFALLLFPAYLLDSSRMISKPKAGIKPRVLWACAPIINIKYASDALRRDGYISKTMVSTYWRISQKSDFDLYRLELFSFYRGLPQIFVRLIEPYFSFIYALRNFDIFHLFFDGGILNQTPLRFFELQLLHLFGKKVVVMPYGADVHVLSRMQNPVFKFGQLYHYRDYAVPRNDLIARWISYFSRHADCCVGSAAFDSLYRWDILPVSYVAIDTDAFRPLADYEYLKDGKSEPVIVVHSPNHRVIKGTEYIIAAIERLQSEGLQIEFRLLEGIKNTEVRALLERSDILVELLVSGYGLSGIEGMSLGKPVISNYQGDTRALRYYSYLNECPIVQACPDTIYEKLKWLIENPAVRKKIGENGRHYVTKYHSYVSQQVIWEQVYRKIWYRDDVDLMMLFHPLFGHYAKLYDARVVRDQKGETRV